MSQTFQLTLNLEWSEKSQKFEVKFNLTQNVFIEKCYKMFLPKLMEL